jgi:hypothetical protein
MRGPSSPEIIQKEFNRLKTVPIPGNIIMMTETGEILDQLVNFEQDQKRRHLDENGKPYQPTVVERGGIAPGFDLRALRDKIASMPETDPDLDPPESEPKPQPVQTAEQVEDKTKALQERLRKLEQQLTVAQLQAQQAAQSERKVEEKLVDEVLQGQDKKPYEPPKVTWTKVAPGQTPPRQQQPPKPQPPKDRLGRWLEGLAAAKFRVNEMRHMERRAKVRRYIFIGTIFLQIAFGDELSGDMVEKAYESARKRTRL